MSLNINPSETVSFTGYRPEKIKNSEPDNDFLFAEIQARLLGTVHELAERGYKIFLSGMAAGFDLMAARAVLLAQNTYPDIELICVIPFPEQAAKFPLYWKSEHANVLKQAQRHITISGKYHRGVFHQRNDFLVRNCSVIVCYYDGQRGGTHYTVELAKTYELEIRNLCNIRQNMIIDPCRSRKV